MHLLVAAFVGYTPPPVQTPADDGDQADAAGPPAWMGQAMGSAIPGPQTARTAATQDEALAAFERHFFGTVKDVEQL